MLFRAIGRFFAAIAATLIIGRILPGGILMLPVMFGLCYWIYLGWKAYVQVMLKELLLGYTTSPFIVGGTKLFSGRRWQGLPPRTIPWNYAGVWELDGQGNVISAPDHKTPPPGIYPSATKEGVWELWTGTVWSGQFYDEHPLA
jgi:hypothetical protein